MEAGETFRWAGLMALFIAIIAGTFVFSDIGMTKVTGDAIANQMGVSATSCTLHPDLAFQCSKSCRRAGQCDAYRINCAADEQFSCVCVLC